MAGVAKTTVVIVALLCTAAQLSFGEAISAVRVEPEAGLVELGETALVGASRKLQGGAIEIVGEFTGDLFSADTFSGLAESVSDFLIDFISGPFEALSSVLQEQIGNFLGITFPELLSPLQEGIASFFDQVVPTLNEVFVGPIVEFFNNTLPDLSLELGLELEDFFNNVLPGLADSTIGAVEEFLNDIFPGLDVDLQEPIADFLDNVIGGLSENLADEIIDFFKTGLPNLSNAVAVQAVDFFDNVFPTLAAALQQPAADFFDFVLPNLSSNVQELAANFFDSVLGLIPEEEEQRESIDFFNDVLPGLIEIVQEGSSSFFDVVLPGLLNDTSAAVDPLLDFFDNDFGGLFSFVEDTVDDILGTIFGTFTEPERDEFADFLDNLLSTLPLSTQSALTDYVDTFLKAVPQEQLGPIILFLDSLDTVTKSNTFPTDPDLAAIANEFTERLCQEIFCSTDGPAVCARNGIQYDNQCALECADIGPAQDDSCCSSCEVFCAEDGIRTTTPECDTACQVVSGAILPCANISLSSAAPEIGVVVGVGASTAIDAAFVAFDLSQLPTVVVASAEGVAADVLNQDFIVEITGDAVAVIANGDDSIPPASGGIPKNLAKAIFNNNANGAIVSVFDAEVFLNGESISTFLSADSTVTLSDIEDSGGCTNALGDFNGDGDVNVLDVVLTVSAIVAGDAEPGSCGQIAANINGDANLDVLDVVLLVNQIVN